jgi:hypothetical protein
LGKYLGEYYETIASLKRIDQALSESIQKQHRVAVKGSRLSVNDGRV